MHASQSQIMIIRAEWLLNTVDVIALDLISTNVGQCIPEILHLLAQCK